MRKHNRYYVRIGRIVVAECVVFFVLVVLVLLVVLVVVLVIARVLGVCNVSVV